MIKFNKKKSTKTGEHCKKKRCCTPYAFSTLVFIYLIETKKQ